MEKHMNKKFIDVSIDGREKKPRRRPTQLYKNRWNKLEPGQIARVSIYNWNVRCNTPPQRYIHRVYKDVYKVIETDNSGFTVLCLQKKERWPSRTE
jgi:hypothetical protein